MCYRTFSEPLGCHKKNRILSLIPTLTSALEVEVSVRKQRLVFPPRRSDRSHCCTVGPRLIRDPVSAALRQTISDVSLVRTCYTFMDTATCYLPHRWGCLQKMGKQRILRVKGGWLYTLFFFHLVLIWEWLLWWMWHEPTIEVHLISIWLLCFLLCNYPQ